MKNTVPIPVETLPFSRPSEDRHRGRNLRCSVGLVQATRWPRQISIISRTDQVNSYFAFYKTQSLPRTTMLDMDDGPEFRGYVVVIKNKALLGRGILWQTKMVSSTHNQECWFSQYRIKCVSKPYLSHSPRFNLISIKHILKMMRDDAAITSNSSVTSFLVGKLHGNCQSLSVGVSRPRFSTRVLVAMPYASR